MLLRWSINPAFLCSAPGVTGRSTSAGSRDGIDARGFLGRSRSFRRGRRAHSALKPAAVSRQAWLPATAIRLLIGLAGFGLGAVACLVLAVVEIGAWVLIVPPRSLNSRAAQSADDARDIPVRSSLNRSRSLLPTVLGSPVAGTAHRAWMPPAGRCSCCTASPRTRRRGTRVAQRRWSGGDGTWPRLTCGDTARARGRLRRSAGSRPMIFEPGWIMLADRLARVSTELPFRPVLWGRSMGAAIAVRAAAREPRVMALRARVAHGRPRCLDGRGAAKAAAAVPDAAGPAGHPPRRQARGSSDPSASTGRRGGQCHLSQPDRPWHNRPDRADRRKRAGWPRPLRRRLAGWTSTARRITTSSPPAARRFSIRSRPSLPNRPPATRPRLRVSVLRGTPTVDKAGG